MSKSNKFGYSGVNIPTQAFKANVGKFDPAEINELVQEDKWTQYGQLEFINTYTADGSSSALYLTNIQEDVYSVHLLVAYDFYNASNTRINGRFSSDNGSSAISNSNYYKAVLYRNTSNSDSGISKNSSGDRIDYFIGTDNSTSTKTGGVINYLYNLGDSTKYSYFTQHGMQHNSNNTTEYYSVGGGMLRETGLHNAIYLYTQTGANMYGKFSLYGVKGY